MRELTNQEVDIVTGGLPIVIKN